MKRILPLIVISQFFCTSLWFAGNAIMPDIIRNFQLAPNFLAHLTSAVQSGFITGTLVFAVFTISDRFSPSKVFFFSSIIAALSNLGITYAHINAPGLLLFRFATGFFLAGIYPVGMKIASDHFQKGLGRSLGFLVGALVLGTAFPHLLRSLTASLPWKYVVFTTSALSVLGGLTIFFLVPDGPYRKAGQKLNVTAFFSGFRNPNFRSAAFGYFGHMWELYTFWAFVPVMLSLFARQHPEAGLNVPLCSFMIIASGGISCALGGLLSQRYQPKHIAATALSLSGCCCLLSPVFLSGSSATALLIFLLFWGLVATADSPMFSTLVAQNAPEESRGTSLTIVNCIGFAITIVSIQFLNMLSQSVSSEHLYMALAAGPVLGLCSMYNSYLRRSDI